MLPESGNSWVDMMKTTTLATTLRTRRNEKDRRGAGVERRWQWLSGALREHVCVSDGVCDKRATLMNPRNEWHAPMPPSGGLPQATRSAGGT